MIPRPPSPSQNTSSFWYSCGIFLLTTSTVASLALFMTTTRGSNDDDKNKNKKTQISVAFLGNSIQYFNDCPRLVESMLRASAAYDKVQQDSCLRGGATITSLWHKGNGMGRKFATPPALSPDHASYDIGAGSPQALLLSNKLGWNFLLWQDHTQHPARPKTRQESMDTLTNQFLPLFHKQQSKTKHATTILLLQTYAYRVPGIKDSADLGDFHAFTECLAEGYQAYADALRQGGVERVQIVPMGRAVQWLYTHRRYDLWESLYSWDDFHPSPHGTWLQACLIFLALTDGAVPPPTYNALWWDTCRYMQPPEEKPLPLPTVQEAEELRQVALMIHFQEQKQQKQKRRRRQQQQEQLSEKASVLDTNTCVEGDTENPLPL